MRWWGVDCMATLSVLLARSSGSLVCVFYSQVNHGECSQVSVRCQVATCLCVFKAAVAWIVFTAQRERRRQGGRGRRGEGAGALM